MTGARGRFAQLADMLATLRDPHEGAVIISIGSHAPSIDCRNGSFTASVEQEGITETSEAVHLHDAVLLARAKVKASLERREKERAEAKAVSNG